MCPEQYDVFLGKKQVAYVRLRHGRLTVSMPNHSGEIVYVKLFNQDQGGFCGEKQRQKYLALIEKKILEKVDIK